MWAITLVSIDEEISISNVVRVMVTVHHIGDGNTGDIANRILQLPPDCWRCVDEYHAFGGDEEEGLIGTLCDHVCAIANVEDRIAFHTKIRSVCCSWQRSIDV